MQQIISKLIENALLNGDNEDQNYDENENSEDEVDIEL